MEREKARGNYEFFCKLCGIWGPFGVQSGMGTAQPLPLPQMGQTAQGVSATWMWPQLRQRQTMGRSLRARAPLASAQLQLALEQADPGICRPLDLRCERFNQHATAMSLLVEVGSVGDTLARALPAAQSLGRALARLLTQA